MAGTCKYCGADTWGRYRICPECRKERKRKGGYSSSRGSGSGERWVCNSCGYGWKSKKSFGNPAICPRCKKKDIIPYAKTPEGKREFILKLTFIIGVFVVFFVFINSSSKSFEGERVNSPQIENVSPQEQLTNFCTTQFSNAGIFDLEKTEYHEDFSSASDYIMNNYENSALTQEQKEHNINYIIENELPKQDYPIIITSGSKREGQVTSQGFYYCNENGLI